MIQQFERKLITVLKDPWCDVAAVSSGTAGLHLAVIAAGLTGRNVVTTPFSFVASTNCLLYERCNVRFVDIDEETFRMDLNQLEDELRLGVARGVLAVDVFGIPAITQEMAFLCSTKYQAKLIEDAAEALGSSRDGVSAGLHGHLGVLAFYPNKQITTGEGGAVISMEGSSEASLIRSLRNQGRASNDSWLTHEHLGFNYRMSELHAAVGLAQLERLHGILMARSRIRSLYEQALEGLPVRLVQAPVDSDVAWFSLVVRLPEGVWNRKVIQHMASRGVETRAYFPCIHKQPYWKKFGSPRSLPHAEKLSESLISLPFYGSMYPDDVGRVVEALRSSI